MRVLALTFALLSPGCSERSTSGADDAGDPSTTRPDAAADEPEPTEPVLGLEPRPLGVVIRSLGERRCGPLRVLVEEREDGALHLDVQRLVRAEAGERIEIGTGTSFAEDPTAPWFVYVHTTHEAFAYDGRGRLTRHAFALEFASGSTPTAEEISAGAIAVREGAPMTSSVSELLTAGPEWKPGEKLRTTLPARLLELIEGR